MNLVRNVATTEAYSVIRQAILSKQSVEAMYQGHRRLMSPHVLGYNKYLREQALFYQFGGTSKSGLEPVGSPNNWRCIPVQLLTELRVLESGEWETGPNHSRPQTCVSTIEVEVVC